LGARFGTAAVREALKGSGRGRHTWWELAASEEPDEDLGPWRRAAVAQSSARRHATVRAREKESARGGGGGGNAAIAQSEVFGRGERSRAGFSSATWAVPFSNNSFTVFFLLLHFLYSS